MAVKFVSPYKTPLITQPNKFTVTIPNIGFIVKETKPMPLANTQYLTIQSSPVKYFLLPAY
jgi:hypothetical protein